MMKRKARLKSKRGFWVAIGIALGTSLGVVFNKLAIFLAVGIAIGVILDTSKWSKNNNRDKN